MEKEKITKPEEGNKKKHKRALLLLLLILLVVIGCTVGAVVMTFSNSGENDGRLYYNVEQLEHIGGDGLSTREPESDGYYSVLLAVDGEQIEYKVAEKALVDEIDNMDLMGLSVDKKGVITEVFDPEEVTGGEVVNRWFVTAADSTSVTVSDTGNEDGLTYTLKLTENTGIYDITGLVEPVGQSTTIEKGDCIRAFKDKEGGIRYIFTVIADTSAFMGATHEGYCEHCKKEVTWYEWEETSSIPTSAGHWCVMNNVQLTKRYILNEKALVVVDLNGKTIDGSVNQRVYSLQHEGATLAIIDQSANKDGSIKIHGNVKNGGIVFVESGNFEFYSGILDASDVDSDYQGLVVRTSKNTTATMYGGTIIGGTTSCGFLGSGSKSGGAGGAVYVGMHSTFTMYDGTIRDGVVNTYTYENGSRTFGCGGNIYLQDYATFVMEGGTISGGKAGNWGGNLYLEKNAVATITGGEIKDGYSEYEGGNVMAHNGATLTISGITISNGVAEKGNGGNVNANNKTTLDMSNVTLVSGKAATGGNLHIGKEAKSATVKNVVMKDGVATKQGGNLSVWGKATLNMSATKILNGQAEVRGGNIMSFGNINMTGVTVSGGKATSTKGNNSNGIGGNVYLADYTETKDGVKTYFDAKIELVNTTVTGGSAPYSRGGNFYMNDKAILVVGKGSVVENGTAKVNGGNIMAQNECTITVNAGGLVQKGTAGSEGGNIRIGKGTLTINNAKVTGGTAKTGGNIVSDQEALVVLTNATIANGQAEKGGNIHITGKSTMNVTDSTITNGVASNQGGNVCVWALATLNLNSGSITNGEAVVKGGNIVCLGYINMSGGTVSGGKATSDKGDNSNGIGGNIYATVYFATEKDAAGNEIKVPYRSVIKMTGGTITNGTSPYSRGGNVYLGDRTDFVVIGNSVIDKGVAKKNGGNLFVQNGSTITLNEGVVVKNGTAGGDAGNVQVGSKATLTVNNATIINGTAKNGGNINAVGTVVIQGDKAVVKNGTAKNGGNFYATETGVITVNGGTITFDDGFEQNTTNGGNICSYGQLAVNGGVIEKGIAKTSGGNIFHENKKEETTFTMTGGSVLGGNANRGGNIFLANDTTSEITGGNITDGVAKLEGGNIAAWSRGSLTVGGNTVVARGIGPNRGANISSLGSLTLKDNCVIGDAEVVAESKIGGNIYVASYVNNETKEVVQSAFTMDGGTVQNGKAYRDDATETEDGVDDEENGGNIYAKDYVAVVLNGGTIKNGEATTHGGNVYTNETCTVAINGATLTAGKAGNQGGNLYYCNTYGDDQVVMTMTAGNITAGTAKRGGNIMIANACAMTMSGGTITDGTTTSDGGNIALWSRGTLTVSGDSVISRGTSKRGGDICALGSVTIKDNVVIGDAEKESTASGTGTNQGFGGNIYIASYMADGKLHTKSTLTMEGGLIQNGKAELDGGCVYVKDYADIVMTGGHITSGTVDRKGGNIYIVNGNITMTKANENVETKITDGTSQVGTSNTAGIGGNIYIENGTLDVTNATISGGVSKSSRAGNVYLQAATVNLRTGAMVSGGTAQLNGGNIMSNGACQVNILGGTVTGGTSVKGQGGNIRLGGSTVMTINGGTITDGTITTPSSDSNGGNIFADSAVTIKLEGGLITITGGKKGTDTNNLYLNAPNDARHVTVINDLDENSSIGITLSRNGFFTAKDIADQKNHTGYFTADLATKKIIYGPDAGHKELGIRCQNK